MKKSIISLFIVAIAAIMFSGCDCQKSVTPEEAKAIAKEAYIYGFPMIMNYKTMNAYVLNEQSAEYKGPFNFIACEARLFTPEDKTIVTPNSDTPYCMMWCDIRNEPLVITVPEMEPERFYHFQLIDLYTHNFAYIGTLTTGNEAGSYLVADIAWQGDKPEYIDEVIRCETPLFFVVVRTQLINPEDIDNVKIIQEAYKLQSLSEFLGEESKAEVNIPDLPDWNEGDQFTAEIYNYMDGMFDLIEPIAEEKELWDRFAKINLGTEDAFDINTFDPEVKEAIIAGQQEAFKDIEGFLAEANKDPLMSAKIFGTREFLTESASKYFGMTDYYMLRAAAAHMGLYGNSGAEAIYPAYVVDSEGSFCNAAENNYTLTFADGELPPVKAFWSLTMYDGKTQLLINNPIDRYLLNSPMMDQFIIGEDGSVTFYIQKDSPEAELQANWLPAPDGPFYMVLRLYGPEEAALKGEWVNPPLEITSN